MQTRGHLYQLMIVVLVLSAGQDVVAGDGKSSPETDLAAPGAPLYEYAVTESVKGLMSKQEQEDLGTKGRPPSPGPDYYWCNNCKTYHKRPAPSAPKQPAAAQKPVATPASPQQNQAALAARPPSPGTDYYWCENCKTYHKRQAQPKRPGDATPAAPHTHATPPAGAEQAQGNYYYCENCKTYHRRQPVAQQPSADVSPIFGGITNSPNPLTSPVGVER